MKKSYLNSERNSAVLLKPLMTIRLLLMVLFVCFFGNVANAATITSTTTGGIWNVATTWEGGIVPAVGDNVIIATTGTNKVTLSKDATCVNLIINAESILDVVDKDLDVNGDIIINGTCTSTSGSPGKIEWNTNGGTLNGTGTLSNIDQLDTNELPKTISATANITFTNASIDGEDNTITNNGIVNISGSNGFAKDSTTTWTNLGTLNYGSPTFLATLIATSTGNTVNYTGANQTTKVTTYFNLTLSGSGTKTFATTPTVKGVLSLEGTAKVIVSNGVITYGPDATLQYNKPSAYTATLEEWPVTFSGAGGVIITNTGVITLGAVKTITNNFSIAIGSSVNLGAGLTHTAGFLTLGGVDTVSGSWGSSSSAATNKNNTYFAAATGIVNSSCTLPVITAQPVAKTICENTVDTFTVVTSASGASFQWQYLKNGTWTNTNALTGFSGHTSATLSTTNVISYSYNGYSVRCIVRSSSGCRTTSNAVLLTVKTKPATPSVIVKQPTCAARTTGTVTISNPINGFSYAVTLEGDTANYLLNTTVFTVGPGTYNVTAKNTCSTTPSIAVPVIISMANTYNGTTWSNGTPTADQDIIFDAHYNINGTDITDITACSCTVNPNVKVFISPTTTLTVTNEVVVNGSLTFKTSTDRSVAKFPKSYSGSLVQKNDNASNIGVITYERNVPAIHPTDYIYWSSPVLNETLLDFVNSTHSPIDRLFSFDAVNDAWKNETANATNTMAQGIGYCIYGPANNSSSSPLDFNASFTGTPNNGVFTISGVGTNQSLLIGNPYPSAINADLFIKANLDVIDGSLYFWTHNTDPDNGQYTYNDYATYNLTGGTGTVGAGQAAPTGVTLPANANPSYVNANIPNGYIAAGQGFFVGSNASISNTITNPTIIFNNSMRIGRTVNGDSNSQFFKTKGNTKGKTTNAIEKDRVWLNLSNDQGVFKQTLVGYITGATNEYDTTFDADSYDSLDSADFYSVNGDSNLVIQGRALPFDENDEVPLGYRTTINGDFTINIDQVDGSLTDQAVFIEDKLANTVTDLKSGNYTFKTAAGTFNERFVLKYTNKTLSVDAMDKEDGILVLYSNNYKTLIIHNNVMDATVNSVVLYNITGQKISNWDVKDSEQTTIQIPIKNISSGIYIVKVNTTTGESSKKIIVN